MAEEGFRLPGSSYEDLANIIVAYGTRDEASNPGDISKLDVVHQSSVSRNNAFLSAIGVLTGEREKLVTEKGRALALALARKDRSAIQRLWRELAARDEFMQNVLSAVKLREGIFPSTLQAYIAHYAGQPRNKPVMTGATAIIGILKAANLLREEAGMLVANYDEDPAQPPSTAAADSGNGAAAGVAEAGVTATDDGESAREIPPPSDNGREERPRQTEVSVSTGSGEARVTVHVHVDCGPEELDGLAPRIRKLLREIEGG